jgi:hypothetical protein
MRRRTKTILIVAVVVVIFFSGLAILGFFTSNIACFGSCGHGELLLPSSVVCGRSQSGLECSLSITNSRTMNVKAVGCRIQVGNTSVAGVIGGTTTFKAGESVNFFCGIQGTEPSVGSQAIVTIQLDNGDSAGFSGTWS